MKLTDDQISLIEDRLEKEGVKHESLFEDLLDHLCCVVEIKLKRGLNFQEALASAIDELAPNGLDDLEKRTRFLLNSKRIIIMKKLMYLVGFIGAATFSVGTLFKIMHWPGANMASLIGLILLLLIFIPLWALDRYKYEISRALSARLKFFSGIASSVIIGMSIIFKIFHLQGADILLVLGAMIFVFGYLPFLFFSMYKKSVS